MFLKFFKISLLVIVTLSLAGCGAGGNTPINLLYGPVSGGQAVPLKNTKVCVVLLEDLRKRPEVGVKSGGEFYVANSPVADWVSRALADELVQQGYTVSYAQNIAQATASGVDYIVSGSVEEVWVQEVSSITFETRVQLTAKAWRPGGKNVFQETVSSTLSRKVFPMTSPAEGLLKETLQDLLTPLVQKLSQKI